VAAVVVVVVGVELLDGGLFAGVWPVSHEISDDVSSLKTETAVTSDSGNDPVCATLSAIVVWSAALRFVCIHPVQQPHTAGVSSGKDDVSWPPLPEEPGPEERVHGRDTPIP
jgi:hypothetical protein